jgi:hypothetical protein
MSNQAIRDILIVARELLAEEYEYRHDPEHRSRPRSPGWEKTNRGWRRGLEKQQRRVKPQPQTPSSVYAKHSLTRRGIDKVLLRKFDKQHAKEVASAVSDYVRDCSSINKTLRKGKPSSEADSIAEFLRAAPKYPASETLYRGFSWDRKELSKVTSAVSKRKSVFISDKGFSSTSVDKKIARGFSTHDGTTKSQVVLQIHGSKDGVAIGLQGYHLVEKEVLLPPGAKFRIRDWHLEDEKGHRIEQCEKGWEQFCFTVLEADRVNDKRTAAVEQKISLGQSPSSQSSGLSRGFIQRMTDFVPEVEIIDEPHLRVAHELFSASADLKEYVRFTFDDVDPKAADFVNAVCSEIDDLADRIRRNEGLELKVERDSQDDDTEVRILMSDHEAMKAIREEMIEELGKLGKEKKLDVKVD